MGNGIVKEKNRGIICNNNYCKIRKIFFIPHTSKENEVESKYEIKTEVVIGPPGIRGKSKKQLWT